MNIRPLSVREDTPPVPSLPDNEEICNIFTFKKTKSPPPVSMKRISMVHREPSPPPRQQVTPAPPMPQHKESYQALTGGEPHTQDPWEAQRRLWRSRRQSAGEALQTRGSFDNFSRPSSTRPSLDYRLQSHNEEEIRPQSVVPTSRPAWPSLEYERHSASHSQLPSHPLTNKPSSEQPTPDDRQHLHSQSRSKARLGKPQTSFENASFKNSPLGPRGHQSKESLTLDRYNGGLAFGYEPGYGLGGSAGMRGGSTSASRKSVDVSMQYGVDFSDVPVILVQQRRKELSY